MTISNESPFLDGFASILTIHLSGAAISVSAAYYFNKIAEMDFSERNIRRAVEWLTFTKSTLKGCIVYTLTSSFTFFMTKSINISLATGLALDLSVISYLTAQDQFVNN